MAGPRITEVSLSLLGVIAAAGAATRHLLQRTAQHSFSCVSSRTVEGSPNRIVPWKMYSLVKVQTCKCIAPLADIIVAPFNRKVVKLVARFFASKVELAANLAENIYTYFSVLQNGKHANARLYLKSDNLSWTADNSTRHCRAFPMIFLLFCLACGNINNKAGGVSPVRIILREWHLLDFSRTVEARSV